MMSDLRQHFNDRAICLKCHQQELEKDLFKQIFELTLVWRCVTASAISLKLFKLVGPRHYAALLQFWREREEPLRKNEKCVCICPLTLVRKSA